MKVKQLKWCVEPDSKSEYGYWPGSDDICYSLYAYVKNGAPVCMAWLIDPDCWGDLPESGPYTSVREAKAACQADFERRVLSCLEEGE